MSDYAFPFFGAGEAEYFEYAWMLIKLSRPSKPLQREAIEAAAPPAFEGGLTFKGPIVSVGSPDYVHLAISAYDADDGEDDDLHGRPIFAAPSRVRRFNEDIERWLRDVHGEVPISVVVRPEDGEAGGTQLSPWHDWSVDRLAEVLAGFQDHIAKKRRKSPATRALDEILELAEESGADIPDAFFQWWRPEVALMKVFRSADVGRALDAIARLGCESEGRAV